MSKAKIVFIWKFSIAAHSLRPAVHKYISNCAFCQWIMTFPSTIFCCHSVKIVYFVAEADTSLKYLNLTKDHKILSCCIGFKICKVFRVEFLQTVSVPTLPSSLSPRRKVLQVRHIGLIFAVFLYYLKNTQKSIIVKRNFFSK